MLNAGELVLLLGAGCACSADCVSGDCKGAMAEHGDSNHCCGEQGNGKHGKDDWHDQCSCGIRLRFLNLRTRWYSKIPSDIKKHASDGKRPMVSDIMSAAEIKRGMAPIIRQAQTNAELRVLSLMSISSVKKMTMAAHHANEGLRSRGISISVMEWVFWGSTLLRRMQFRLLHQSYCTTQNQAIHRRCM